MRAFVRAAVHARRDRRALRRGTARVVAAERAGGRDRARGRRRAGARRGQRRARAGVRLELPDPGAVGGLRAAGAAGRRRRPSRRTSASLELPPQSAPRPRLSPRCPPAVGLSAALDRRDRAGVAAGRLVRARRLGRGPGRRRRGQVHLLDVLVEHPRRREPPERRRHRAPHLVDPGRGQPVRVALVVARDDLLLEEPVQVLRRRTSPGRPRRRSSPGRRSPSRCRRVQPSSHQPSRTLKLTPPLTAAFIPLVPDASSGRRGLLSQTSTPGDEIAGDPHVVVLEDEDAAAELRPSGTG